MSPTLELLATVWLIMQISGAIFGVGLFVLAGIYCWLLTRG